MRSRPAPEGLLPERPAAPDQRLPPAPPVLEPPWGRSPSVGRPPPDQPRCPPDVLRCAPDVLRCPPEPDQEPAPDAVGRPPPASPRAPPPVRAPEDVSGRRSRPSRDHCAPALPEPARAGPPDRAPPRGAPPPTPRPLPPELGRDGLRPDPDAAERSLSPRSLLWSSLFTCVSLLDGRATVSQTSAHTPKCQGIPARACTPHPRPPARWRSARPDGNACPARPGPDAEAHRRRAPRSTHARESPTKAKAIAAGMCRVGVRQCGHRCGQKCREPFACAKGSR